MSIMSGACFPAFPLHGTSFGNKDEELANKRVCGHWTFEYGGMKADLEFKRDALGLIETGR